MCSGNNILLIFCTLYAGLCKILFSENTIPIALLQYYYWAPFGYLGNTSVVQNGGNTIAIVFLFGNHSGKIEKLN